MAASIDTTSAVPLYHQIADAIRYEIATGSIQPGARLPSLHDGAAQWGVTLHTVRRAYCELAERGVVKTETPFGTTILPSAEPTPKGRKSPVQLRAFLASIARRARRDFGLETDELACLLSRWEGSSSSGSVVVYVAECSETQSVDLASQVEQRWKIRAQPWCLVRNEEPPAGIILTTYFHYNDLRLRWPARISDLHFVAIRPDPSLVATLLASHRGRGRKTVTLCEREPSMGASIAADLSALLPPEKFRVVTKVLDMPGQLLRDSRESSPILFSPRIWGELDCSERDDPRAWEARYVFDDTGIDAIAHDLGWQAVANSPVRPSKVAARRGACGMSPGSAVRQASGRAT